MNSNLHRCSKCLIPSNYPQIRFDENGVCNFCNDKQEPHQYSNIDVLKRDIDHVCSKYPQRPFDCVVGLSGGRDSSYLLYFAKEILKLKVLAVSLDHDYLTPSARHNIATVAEKLGVDVHYIKNEVLNKASRDIVRHWVKKPDVAMCISFCTGCRYGLNRLIPDYVRKQGIPVLLTGETPEEQMDYRQSLLCDSKKINTVNMAWGFCKRLLKNPSYFLSPKSLFYQFQDFLSTKKGTSSFPTVIKPFYYVERDEEQVLSIIASLGWRYDKPFKSAWRSDCYIGVLRQFFYKKALGFNDLDIHYSDLIRNNVLTREEALSKIESEGNNREEFVREILDKFYDIDYDKVNIKW